MFKLIMVVVSLIADLILWAFRRSMQATRTGGPLPRLIQFAQHAFQKRSYGKTLAGGKSPALKFALGIAAALALLMLPVDRILLDTPLSNGTLLMLLGFTGRTKAVDGMASKRTDLKKLLVELKTAQDELAGGKVPTQPEAEALDAKATEAETLQNEIKAYDDRMKRFGRIQDLGSQVGDPVLPNDDAPEDEPPDIKGLQRAAGYIRVGDYVTAQKAMKEFERLGRPKAPFKLASLKTLLRGRNQKEILVPLTAEQVREIKAVPTIGTGIIEPTLIPDVVRVTEHDMLTLRDVLDVSRTTSDAVKYTRITSYTRAAATVARSGRKPEAALAMDAVTEPVRTAAVWIPVEEQQLSDYPALSGIINNELLYDLDKHIEELVIYGDGIGENFEGIITNPAVLNARIVVNDTLIDIARRGITDVRRAGYEPNAILVDPLDWETIVLSKGSDNRYVWVVVTEGATQRLWAVPVIETVAMEDFAGNATEQRHMLVGDFLRGATLWDREESSISTGWINEQFIHNQRTILAELRAAFGVKRPGAFRKHLTQAAVAS